jgi:hypothetical protein
MSEDPHAETRANNGQFGPGNPGKPPGARNHMSGAIRERFLQHVEGNMDRVLDRMARDYFPQYAKIALQLASGAATELPSPDDAEAFLQSEYPRLFELDIPDAHRWRAAALAALNKPGDVRSQLAGLENLLELGLQGETP